MLSWRAEHTCRCVDLGHCAADEAAESVDGAETSSPLLLGAVFRRAERSAVSVGKGEAAEGFGEAQRSKQSLAMLMGRSGLGSTPRLGIVIDTILVAVHDLAPLCHYPMGLP